MPESIFDEFGYRTFLFADAGGESRSSIGVRADRYPQKL